MHEKKITNRITDGHHGDKVDKVLTGYWLSCQMHDSSLLRSFEYSGPRDRKLKEKTIKLHYNLFKT